MRYTNFIQSLTFRIIRIFYVMNPNDIFDLSIKNAYTANHLYTVATKLVCRVQTHLSSNTLIALILVDIIRHREGNHDTNRH